MKYYSTRNKELKKGLKEAVQLGLAEDRGLYMPEKFRVLSRKELESLLKADSLAEVAYVIAHKLFGEDIESAALKQLCEEALNFDTPLVQVEENIYALELFHGPTLAFKDVGARFMARVLQYFREGDETVHVLYPSGQVSPLQEKQFTTLGQNITALEIDGSFDDCQRMVKEAFADEDLRAKLTLTSANSINLARFMPQSFYYFRALGLLWKAGIQLTGDSEQSVKGSQQSKMGSEQCVFAVPSGNYGNLTAGLLAREMGMPVHTFLAASNANTVVPEYLQSGVYHPKPSVSTIANAMDVGDPSNFERIMDIFDGQHERVAAHLKGYSYSDEQIRLIIKKVYDEHNYILDPHGATGYEAAREYTEANPGTKAIFLETAHPAKFSEHVNEAIGRDVEIPERLAAFAKCEKQSLKMRSSYEDLKKYLTDRIQ